MKTAVLMNVLALIVSHSSLSYADANGSSDRVTIVINNNHGATQVAKKKKKSKGAKPKNSEVAKKAPKKTGVTLGRAAPKAVAMPVIAPKTTQVVNRQVRTPYVGARPTLANQYSARANGYTPSNQSATTTAPEDAPVLANPRSALTFPNSFPATNTGVNQAKLAAEDQNEKTSPFSFKYRTYNQMNLNALENDPSGPGGKAQNLDYTIQAWDRFSFGYAVNKNVQFTVMPQVYHTWFQDAGRPQSGPQNASILTQSYEAYWGDTALIIGDDQIAKFKNDFVLKGAFSYYLPTSQQSQAAGLAGETRTNLNLNKQVGNWNFVWTEEFRYFIQSYETSTLTDGSGKPLQNVNYRLYNLLDVGYNITKKLNFTLEGGLMNEYLYPDSFNGALAQHNDYIIMNPDLGYTFTENLALDLGIWEQYNSTNPTANGQPETPGYTPFASFNQSQVYLMGTIKL